VTLRAENLLLGMGVVSCPIVEKRGKQIVEMKGNSGVLFSNSRQKGGGKEIPAGWIPKLITLSHGNSVLKRNEVRGK